MSDVNMRSITTVLNAERMAGLRELDATVQAEILLRELLLWDAATKNTVGRVRAQKQVDRLATKTGAPVGQHLRRDSTLMRHANNYPTRTT